MPADAKTIYFFLTPPAVTHDHYAHTSVVLAEGLAQLGFRIYANIDSWQAAPADDRRLFRHDPGLKPADCAFNVLAYDWMHYINVIPHELAENTKSLRVYIEDAGWLKTPGLSEPFRRFDLVLKAHYNERCRYPAGFRPWAFGLSERILRATEEPLPFEKRRRALLVNFGATHSYRHALRDCFEERVYPRLTGCLELDRQTNSRASPPTTPYDRLMWEQTSGRHYPDYYELLRTAAACSCVGGQLAPARPHDWSVLGGGGHRVKIREWMYRLASGLAHEAPRWNQWESWRFWESLSAGCAALALDFGKYGVRLPVQPENWKHYIGLDLDNLGRDVDRIVSDPGLIGRVAQEGRAWAREHYSPIATARRFLELTSPVT